jgi:DNA-binding NtrC family response regulator
MGTASHPRKILVVDDNIELAENLAEILEVIGCEAMVAASAEAALERIAAGGISAVVTDFRLPGLSGADLILELRRSGSAIPVVVMSAYSDASMVERAEAAGALQVMTKPVDVDGLRRVVDGFDTEIDVLVVDDNPELADNLADALRTRGMAPQVTNNAGDALALRRQARAALIDYRLPDRDGIQLALRLIARNPGIRILFVSAHGEEADAQVRRRLPAARCLAKPVDTAEILRWAAGDIERAAL